MITQQMATTRSRSAAARAQRAQATRRAGEPRTALDKSVVTPASELRMFAGDPDFMASLARGLAVIRAFTLQRRHPTIAQLSQRTGIPRAAVRRCLYTLSQLGYVASDDGRSYTLRPGVLALGYAYLSSTPFPKAVQPLLERITREIHESSSMAVLDGDDILYIARSATDARVMSIDLGIGSRLPAYCTSMGRVLLAGLPPAELRQYLVSAMLTRRTGRTVDTPEALVSVLKSVRRNRYAIVDQELEIGLRSIAVPVTDGEGRTIAAINVGTQSSRVSIAEMEGRFLPLLRAAAHESSLLLAR